MRQLKLKEPSEIEEIAIEDIDLEKHLVYLKIAGEYTVLMRMNNQYFFKLVNRQKIKGIIYDTLREAVLRNRGGVKIYAYD